MEKKCALVTGSSNGIGEAIVKQLSKLDYKLVVTGRDENDIKRVAEECAKLSPTKQKPLEVVANLDNEADVDRLFEMSMVHFNNKLNLLVNNAGLGIVVAHTKIDECYDAYKRVMQVNFNAVVRLTLLAAPVMKETAGGVIGGTSIVNISSIASLRPTQSLFAYGVTKAALNSFTESMAVELAPLIRVNCISPGPVETKIIERAGFSLDAFKEKANDLTPLKRVGRTSEIAEVVMFFADFDKTGFITGANLTVDGGTVITPLRWD